MFKQPDFLCLWWVGFTSFLIRWLEILVFGIVAYQQTGSAFWVAMMTMLRLLPMALFGATFGAIAERLPRHRVLLLVIFASLVTAVVMTLISAYGQLEVWHLAVAAFINGTAWATDNSVRRAIIGEVAGQAQMGRAMSIEVGTSNATRLIGPGVGGVLLATGGITGVLLLTSVLYTLALLSILWVFGTGPRAQAASASHGSLFSSLAEGIAVLRNEPRLTGAMWVTVVFNIFGWPVLSMIPVIGTDELGLTPQGVGFLASTDGLGAFIGALVIARLSQAGRYGRIYLIGITMFLAALPVFSLAPGPELAAVALFFAGIGQAGFSVMQATITFVVSPEGRRSQAMGLMTMCIGVGPIGFLLLGALAEQFGAPLTAVLMSVTGLLTLAVTWRWWRLTWKT
ncbi:MAG: MFS transporter [Burkholderiaceae bacterium]